jgi:hypothetical protein
MTDRNPNSLLPIHLEGYRWHDALEQWRRETDGTWRLGNVYGGPSIVCQLKWSSPAEKLRRPLPFLDMGVDRSAGTIEEAVYDVLQRYQELR